MTSRMDAEIHRLTRRVGILGGVARVRTLHDDGSSAHSIRTAITRGVLARPRRGWVALADADPVLVGAVTAGVILTCVTQAARLGLWVVQDSVPHVAASAHSGRVSTVRSVVHWRTPIVARHPDALVDPVENVLDVVAACQPAENALAVWESALKKGLVSMEALRRMPFGAAARSIRDFALPWSDSGLETIFVVRLRWLDVRIVPQVWIDGHRVDFLIGDRLAVQIDGGHHVGPQREQDIAHDAALMLLGYHVIRIGYFQVFEHWHEVQELILRAIAQGRHLAA